MQFSTAVNELYIIYDILFYSGNGAHRKFLFFGLLQIFYPLNVACTVINLSLYVLSIISLNSVFIYLFYLHKSVKI